MSPAAATQQEALPPQPKSILRGHKAQVHAAAFVRHNERLLTGDADGFVVAWDLTIMRPRAVWRAHENAILGIAGWGSDSIITHGRDNKLVVWKLAADDEAAMSTTLPLDPAAAQRPKPWMLHLLEVNTMNFCSFAFGPTSAPVLAVQNSTIVHSDLLIAVPNTLISEAVDIYHIPSQDRIHVVKLGGDHGMAMALALLWLNNLLTLLVGYEDGMAIVAQLEDDGSWFVIYRNQSHKQPVLSLDVAPSHEYFITSSADAAIVKHPLLPRQASAVKGLIGNSLDTVGPTDNHMPRIAHEGGKLENSPEKAKSVSLLTAALASQPPTMGPKAAEKREIQTEPLKIVDTKHSGQQSLRLRSDGRIFATAGWDSKIRVYSAKTMREVAVLKWHPVGCFAAAFADVTVADTDHVKTTTDDAVDRKISEETSLVTKVLDKTVKDRRIAHAKSAHWLAAGSKDGKVSLWDIF